MLVSKIRTDGRVENLPFLKAVCFIYDDNNENTSLYLQLLTKASGLRNFSVSTLLRDLHTCSQLALFRKHRT